MTEEQKVFFDPDSEAQGKSKPETGVEEEGQNGSEAADGPSKADRGRVISFEEANRDGLEEKCKVCGDQPGGCNQCGFGER